MNKKSEIGYSQTEKENTTLKSTTFLWTSRIRRRKYHLLRLIIIAGYNNSSNIIILLFMHLWPNFKFSLV